MNESKIMSFAGVWTPITNISDLGPTPRIATGFYALFKPANSSNYGVITTGWKFSDERLDDEDVSIGLFVPNELGNLSLKTSLLVNDPTTNGSGSVVVADFNGDTFDDIFLVAHSEDPMIPRASTAYLQDQNGLFFKVKVNDSVIAHDAKVIYLNGSPAVLTSTFDATDKSNKTASVNPIYVFDGNGSFLELYDSQSWYDIARVRGAELFLANLSMSAEVGNFFGDSLQVIRADNTTFPADWSKPLTSDIAIYHFDQSGYSAAAPLQRITPYLSTLEEYRDYPSLWGEGLTHVYRLWKDDLNQDGHLDLLAAQSMWNGSNSQTYPNALQILINDGVSTFLDQTKSLNPEMSLNNEELSYTPFILDIDGSGINTYLFPNHANSSYERQTNYVLLNDGTGRLYIGLHDEFVSYAKEVTDYLLSQESLSQMYTISKFPYGNPVKFIPIPNQVGQISFLAEVRARKKDGSKDQVFLYVNFDSKWDATKQFDRNIEIDSRNNSANIRTWAGDDTISDSNANKNLTNIDGGLGLDTVLYAGILESYVIAISLTSVEVHDSKNGTVSDTLVNVERLKFSDVSVALDLDGNAGQVAKLLGAVFGKGALTNKEHVGVGLALIDGGMSYQDLAALAVSVTGKSSSTEVCTLLWTNVFGQAPTAADIAPFKAMLDSNQLSIGQLTTLAADTTLNTDNIDLVGLSQTGLEFV